ncbi:MAG: bifunctional alpha/beta hydrolase/OsmC family protein [Arachnia sp.]
MRTEHVEFRGSHDTSLVGRLDLPDEAPRAFAVFAHCFTCTKDLLAASRISRELAGHGIAVLRFDFTGLGQSGGDFAETTFSSNVADLVRAAEFLRTHHQAPTVLVGHSLGGAAVLAAAEQLPEVRAVATIAAPADTEHVLHLLAGSREQIEENGEAEVCLADRPFRIRREFLDDLQAQPQNARIRRLPAALLVMHSPTDQTVGIDNAALIFRAAHHPKSFVALDGADHMLTRPSDARFVASVLAAWVERYLPEPSVDPEIQTEQEGVVTVSENGDGPYGQRITVGRHVLTADEPLPLGHDTGPSPYDLLLGSLGACTSMTLRMYADRKQWPLTHVSVSLEHSKIHARDCADCETQTGRLDHIERTLHITGDLDDAQRARLVEMADRCPVHRTLNSEISISTTLQPES